MSQHSPEEVLRREGGRMGVKRRSKRGKGGKGEEREIGAKEEGWEGGKKREGGDKISNITNKFLL